MQAIKLLLKAIKYYLTNVYTYLSFEPISVSTLFWVKAALVATLAEQKVLPPDGACVIAASTK